jgi:hypothetical protein
MLVVLCGLPIGGGFGEVRRMFWVYVLIFCLVGAPTLWMLFQLVLVKLGLYPKRPR